MSKLKSVQVLEAERKITDTVLQNLSATVDADSRTQADIAREAGMHPAALSAILNGNRRFSIRMVARISVALGVDPHRMFLEVP